MTAMEDVVFKDQHDATFMIVLLLVVVILGLWLVTSFL
jgi:hypothetical protein